MPWYSARSNAVSSRYFTTPSKEVFSFFCICGTKFFLGLWLFDWLILELSPVISPASAIFPQDQSQKLIKKNGDPACRRNARNDCAQV